MSHVHTYVANAHDKGESIYNQRVEVFTRASIQKFHKITSTEK